MSVSGCGRQFKEVFSFWEHISEEDREELCRHTVAAKYKKGQHVHKGGDECLGMLLIKKGELRVYMLSEDGRDITLYRLSENDVCILAASCVLDLITFDVFIDAEVDSEVYIVDASFFKELSQRNIYAKCFGYEMTAARFSDVMWAMQQILFMSADKRLAIFLNDEMAKNGSDVLKITHEQIARYMGSAREVVSRLLKYFEREKIVELSRGGLKIIDRARLRELTK